MDSSNKTYLLDVVNKRIAELEQQTALVEEMYGIDKDLIEEEPNYLVDIPVKVQIKHKTLKTQIPFENLPGLVVEEAAEKKNNYKTPKEFEESLKFEPKLEEYNFDDRYNRTFEPVIKKVQFVTPNMKNDKLKERTKRMQSEVDEWV